MNFSWFLVRDRSELEVELLGSKCGSGIRRLSRLYS
jgi:hypothetical protein